ncbi:MAG: regulatory protein RecX [Algoriphagus sp.]
MSSWGKNKEEPSPKKSWSMEEARGKLETYCSYQDRCGWEVRRKLYEHEIQGNNVDVLLEELTHSGFLDEARYARSFARGKFRIKKWGKSRISRELKHRQIPSALIKLGLSEIDEEEYLATLREEAEKKWQKTKEKDPYKKRYLVTHYLMGRGFEQDLIREVLDSQLP